MLVLCSSLGLHRFNISFLPIKVKQDRLLYKAFFKQEGDELTRTGVSYPIKKKDLRSDSKEDNK